MSSSTKTSTTIRYREGIYTIRQHMGGASRAEIEAEIVKLIQRGIEASTIEVL